MELVIASALIINWQRETTGIRRLRILGIHDHPLQLGTGPHHHDANRRRMEDPIYRAMVCELAKMILETHNQSHGPRSGRESLKIIAFGVAEQVKGGDRSSDSMLFAKSQVKVLDGEQEASMEEVKPASSNYHTIRRVRREYDINAFAYGYLD